MVLEIHELGQAVTLNEAATSAFSMLSYTANEVVRDTEVQSAVPLISHDVDPASHSRMICLHGKEDVDGRAKPGHDESRVTCVLKLVPIGSGPATPLLPAPTVEMD
jgi:hypothetical protein